MKMDQVAIYCRTKAQEEQIKKSFGLEEKEWIQDTVIGTSCIWGSVTSRKFENTAELQFNYDLGIELEIIHYMNSFCWHDYSPARSDWGKPFISHVGIHLEDDEEFPEMLGAKLVQETKTQSHTNPYLVNLGRTYHYRIFELSPGSYVKYIRRIRGEKEKQT